MSCCGNNKCNYYTRSCDKNCNGCNKCNTCNKCDTCNSCNSCNDCCNRLDGISCPFQNNNDCGCCHSLREAACNLTNQRVIIYVDGCKMCVVIVAIGDCFIKAVNPCTHKIVYFNINRIDNIEDVLPRCY